MMNSELNRLKVISPVLTNSLLPWILQLRKRQSKRTWLMVFVIHTFIMQKQTITYFKYSFIFSLLKIWLSTGAFFLLIEHEIWSFVHTPLHLFIYISLFRQYIESILYRDLWLTFLYIISGLRDLLMKRKLGQVEMSEEQSDNQLYADKSDKSETWLVIVTVTILLMYFLFVSRGA